MTIKTKLLELIYDEKQTINQKLKNICLLLDQTFSHFNWTGFYFKNDDKNELILSEFVGEPTEHTIIPFGKGICGQVALLGQTFLVDDVHQESNYLACSIKTKSEIVVPIFKNGQNIGQIDIDSHTPKAFNEQDKELLQWLCQELSYIL